jgi:hypothetical protein
MIETPLFGRFQGENKRLVFSAPPPYHMLVRGSIGGGVIMILFGVIEAATGVDGPQFPGWWIVTGAAVGLAGIAAAFALTSISFDLGERHYKRRQGPEMFTRTRVGSVNELDAIVLISEPNPTIMAGGVTYHLVLHWKGESQPIMVLQQDTRILPPGQPLSVGAQPLLNAGLKYAQAIGIPFYDNSHFASKCPIPVFR